MVTVALTGAASPLGRKTERLVAEQADTEVVRLAPERRGADDSLLALDELKRQVDGADVVLHLASSVPEMPTAPTRDVELARHVFDAASATSVRHVIVLSDATVYGAWPNNPVPLTDDAVVRPNPGFTWAAERAEIERLAAEWRRAHPGSAVAVLRPVRTSGRDEWLIRALRPGRAVPELADEPPAQFLGIDDLAAAVVVAQQQRLDGVFNVAPDDSIAGEELRSLTGAGPKVRLPERLADRFARWRFRSGLTDTPPELIPYTLHSWVVANDRLRAAGWEPALSNEEACVEAHEASPWATLSPRRRQELALGVAGTAIAGLGVGAAVLIRRVLRR